MIRTFIGMVAVAVFCASPPVHATITVGAWVPAFQGVDYTTGQADTNEIRQQKVFAFRVDLREPAVEFFSTPSNGTNDLETFGQTTTTFVNTYGVALGVNANPFSPVSTVANEPREVGGLAISRGDVVSPFASGLPALLLTRSNQASMITAALASYTNYWTAVAGRYRILIDGVAQMESCTNDYCNQNPRSAVGISADGRFCILMVIDGRQTGWSDGATLYETGQWLARLGAWNGLNLDGGGSTALAKMESGSAVLLNRPSSGVQRVNGNHLGLFAPPIAPVVLTQPVTHKIGLGQSAIFSMSAGGTTPLHYQWRLNGTNIASATGTSFTRSEVQASHCGYYTAVITNTTGAVTSTSALLILTNPPAPPQMAKSLTLSNGTVRIHFVADPGRIYAVQTSSNLVDWLTLANLFNLQTNESYLDQWPLPGATRYYRLRWAP